MIRTFFYSFFFIISIIFVEGENREFPQKVSLLKNENVYCGGVKLSLRHVLTLASCVFGDESSVGASQDYENNVTHYFKTFSSSNEIRVAYKFKSYSIAAIDVHSFKRSVQQGSSKSAAVDGLAILMLDDEIKINKINHPRNNSELSNFTSISPNNVKNKELVMLINKSSKIQEEQFFQIHHDGICQQFVAGKHDDRICAVSQGELSDPCNMYPGDPVYNVNLEIVGLMEHAFTCTNESPVTFVNVQPHKSWMATILSL